MDKRVEMCRSLGFAGPQEVHETVVAGAKKGAPWLKQRGLDARRLEHLGYGKQGMRHLGYTDEILAALGYVIRLAEEEKSAPSASQTDHDGQGPDPKDLIKQDVNAQHLKSLGLGARQCKRAGVDARDLFRVGFSLPELAAEYSLQELRLLGFGPREMNRVCDGSELKRLGYSAAEMRTAGYTIRDLQNFGYNENQIITAGYSIHEITHASLSKHTRDERHLHH
ncbi:hypothetical protein HQ520_15510 [bacterium]|nr:hypothetical protein [bacterium]